MTSMLIEHPGFKNLHQAKDNKTIYCCKPEYQEKTTDLSQVTDKLFHISVVSSTPCQERGLNSQLSGDRH